MTDRPLAPLAIYVVYHPDCTTSVPLANALHTWFRLDPLSTESSAGPPIYFRRALGERENRAPEIQPEIAWEQAELNVVIALVGHHIVGEPKWLKALTDLARQASSGAKRLFLPVALEDSFYKSGSVYADSNPIRLIELEGEARVRELQRTTTGAIARALRQAELDSGTVPPLDVFLSHAKAGGKEIAEQIRDSVRKFGQLTAWYDASDLPYGGGWNHPMQEAAKRGTAAMIATVTDRYAGRPWCWKEATLARTPQPLPSHPTVWTVQPVVAIHAQSTGWSSGLPMFSGVPRTGWTGADSVERIVDRLVLETMLVSTHRSAARALSVFHGIPSDCYLTWVPDPWTLAALRKQLGDKARDVRRIIYPSYHPPSSELTPLLTLFHADTTLHTYEDVWPSALPEPA
jgi:hypothetical protein